MKISVIVCTHNRVHCILDSLTSIVRSISHVMPLDAEIVIVDNASSDNTVAQVTEWAKSTSVPVVITSEPTPGLSRARNRGLRVAKGDLLIWTDDDCIMDENYVRQAVQLAATDTVPVFRGGRVELGNPADLNLTVKTQDHKQRWHKIRLLNRSQGLIGSVFGCNMILPRAVFDKIGFFDERFGAGSHLCAAEDVDYTLRAYFAKIPVEYTPALKVFHFHGRRKWEDGVKLVKGYAISDGALFTKHFCRHPLIIGRGILRQLFLALIETVAMRGKSDKFLSHKETLLYNLKGMMRYIREIFCSKSHADIS